jgi:DOMON domain/Copper type II ascorbate-dependent monooxygenase, C-terminal domain/Copper type II ascorbate-dependent monooxygenase, N-terminal domain
VFAQMKSFAISGLLLFQVSLTLVSAKDPPTYFGGSDNEGYISWLGGTSYERSSFIESTQVEGSGVAVHWTVEGDTIKLAVAAKATGWVGFGIGESGSMLGADIVLFSAESNTLVDSYVLDQAVTPLQDECQSWTLVDSTIDGGFIIFEASRLLNTGDNQDRVLSDDSDVLVPSARVLAAWGDSPQPSFHGDNNARSSIRFFGGASTLNEIETFSLAMESEAEGNFTMMAENYVIPTNRTTYKNFCFTRDDLLALGVDLDQDLHTIGIDALIDSRTRKYVHHFVLAASALPWNSSWPCDEYPTAETAYVWAPGDLPLNLPSNIGSPLGMNGFQSFQLEIHYDNPDGVANVMDSSGIRMFYTSKKREFDMGVFSTGDPQTGLFGDLVSPSQGLVQHTFDCPSSCSANYTSEPLTVIREHLHMHAVGVSMVNAQIRDNEVIRQGQVEYWDFMQQGNLAVVQPSFTIQPGDAFRTVCNYNSNNNETWGLASNEEMCMAFLYYYPRVVIQTENFGDMPLICGMGFGEMLPGCEAPHIATPDFTKARQLGRVFGTPSLDSGTCNAPQTVADKSSGATQSLLYGVVAAASSFILMLWSLW